VACNKNTPFHGLYQARQHGFCLRRYRLFFVEFHVHSMHMKLYKEEPNNG